MRFNFNRYTLLTVLLVVLAGWLSACQPTPVPTTNSGDPNSVKAQPIHTEATVINPETAPSQTQEPTSTSTPTVSPSPTPTATASPTPTITPTPTSAIPDEHYITDISGHSQFFDLGCETSAAIDLATYFGVYINEFEFQYKLPLSDNPDLGFVGNVRDPWGQAPPFSYGVHAAPIAKLLTEYGLPAEGIKGYTLDEIKLQIAEDKPVIAWVIGNCVGGVPEEYTDSEGNTTIVAAYEHVVIITGYNSEKIRYMNNGKFYEAPNEVFLNSWGVLGNMVVIKTN